MWEDCADCSSLFLATHGDTSILEFIVSLIQILIHLWILLPPDSDNIPHVDFRPVAIYGNLGTCFMQQGNSATQKQMHGLQHIPIVCSTHNCCASMLICIQREELYYCVMLCQYTNMPHPVHITHSGSQHYCNIEVYFMLICKLYTKGRIVLLCDAVSMYKHAAAHTSHIVVPSIIATSKCVIIACIDPSPICAEGT